MSRYDGSINTSPPTFDGNPSSGLPPNNTQNDNSVLVDRKTAGGAQWNKYNYDTTGRIFDGDMTINGDLSVQTIISDINVEDSQITMNLNAPGDNFTTGIVMNNTNNTRYSGLLKEGNSNDFYVFANSNTQPTETGWTPEKNANLHLNQILPQSINLINGQERLFVDNTAIRATSDSHEYKTNTGANALEINPSHIHLKYGNNDRIRVDNILTDIRSPDLSNYWSVNNAKLLGVLNADFRFEADNASTKLNSKDGVNSTTIDLQDGNISLNMGATNRTEYTTSKTSLKTPSGNETLFIDPAGVVIQSPDQGRSFSIANGQTSFSDIGGTRLRIDDLGSSFLSPDKIYKLNIADSGLIFTNAVNNVLRVSTDIKVGTDANGYILPLTRGTNGQVLETDGSGNVTWQDPAGGTPTSISNETSNVRIPIANGDVEINYNGVLRGNFGAGGSTIYAPDGIGNLTLDNAEHTFIGNLLCNNDFRVKQVFSLGDGAGEYKFPTSKGADGQILTLINGDLDWANAVATEMKNPSETADLQILDGPILKYKVGAEFADRIRCDTSQNIIRTPSGAGNLLVKDSHCQLSMNSGQSIRIYNTALVEIKCSGNNRLYIDGTESKILSPDNLQFFIVENASATLENNVIYLSSAGIIRQQITNSLTEFFSPDQLTTILLNNSEYKVVKAGTNRIFVDSGKSELKSPNGTSNIEINNVSASISRAGNLAFFTSSAATEIFTPDVSGSVSLENTAIKIIGQPLQVNDAGLAYKFPLNNTGAVTGSVMEYDLASQEVKFVSIPTIRLVRNGFQSIPIATATAVQWNKQVMVRGLLHSTVTNPSRIIATKAGHYQVNAEVRFEANQTGQRICYFIKNGLGGTGDRRWGRMRINSLSDPGNQTEMTSTALIPLSPNDYVQFIVTHDANTALNISDIDGGPTVFAVNEFSCFWVSPL